MPQRNVALSIARMPLWLKRSAIGDGEQSLHEPCGHVLPGFPSTGILALQFVPEPRTLLLLLSGTTPVAFLTWRQHVSWDQVGSASMLQL